MAAVVTLLGTQTFNTTSGTHTVVATPAVNDLIVIVTASTGNTSATAPTDNNSDGLGTYTLIDTAVKVTSADTMMMWVRNSLVGSASSTTFTHAPGASSGGGLGIFKITGMSNVGSAAIRQSAHKNNQGSATTPTPVMGLAVLTTNPVIGAVFNATNAATLTPRGTPAYTERFDVGYATPTTGIETMSIDSGETGTSIAWGGTSASAHCEIAVELQFNTAPTVVLNTPADTATAISTTPDLAFTGTDADADTIEYEVEVDTVNTFGSYATPAIVQTKSSSTSVAASQTATWNSNTTTGNLIVVVLYTAFQTFSVVSSITDSQSNTYTKIDNGTDNNPDIEFWYAKNITGGTTPTITATFSAGTQVTAFIAREYSGIDPNPLDAHVIGTTTGTSPASSGNTSATTVTNELVVGYAIASNATPTFGAGTGYGNLNTFAISGGDLALEDKIVTSTGTQAATFTMGVAISVTVGVATFKAAFSSPLIDKFSVTPDATFTDVTNGAHTHPFPSGEQVKYTVQAGDILTASTVYYWRVRGIDTAGANTYGAWATTQSFTTGAGNKSTNFLLWFRP